jgi:hypothetical protein
MLYKVLHFRLTVLQTLSWTIYNNKLLILHMSYVFSAREEYFFKSEYVMSYHRIVRS